MSRDPLTRGLCERKPTPPFTPSSFQARHPFRCSNIMASRGGKGGHRRRPSDIAIGKGLSGGLMSPEAGAYIIDSAEEDEEMKEVSGLADGLTREALSE